MNRQDWYLNQLVDAGSVDGLEENIEGADHALSLDNGLAAVDMSTTNGGIVSGLEVAWADGGAGMPAAPSLDVLISAGTAYDDEGNRVRIPVNTTVTISHDGYTAIGAGGVPAGGNSTTPGGVMERWVSIFVEFQQLLSDPRIDGTGATVYFQRAESFRFYVRQSADNASPIGSANRPDAQTGMLRLVDVRRNAAGMIDAVMRGPAHDAGNGWRADWINRTDSAATPRVRIGAPPNTDFPTRGLRASMNVRDALAQLLGYYNDHVRNDATTAQGPDAHDASQVAYADAGPSWIDTAGGATTNPPIDHGPAATDGVQGQINKIITDLIAQAALHSGAYKIGTAAEVGAGRPAYAIGGATTLAAGNIGAALVVLLNAVNQAARVTGDTFHGNLLPDDDAHAHTLGASAGTQRWEAFLGQLNVEHIISNIGTGLTPATRTLGDLAGLAAARFNIGINDAHVLAGLVMGAASVLTLDATARITGHVVPTGAGTQNLGIVTTNAWATGYINALVGQYTSLQAVDNNANVAVLQARNNNAYYGDIAQFPDKKGTTTHIVSRMGNYLRRRGYFRDDFLWKGTAQLQYEIWLTAITGADSSVTRTTDADAFGVFTLKAERDELDAGETPTTGHAMISFDSSVAAEVQIAGTSNTRRTHVTARVKLPTIDANSLAHIGFFNPLPSGNAPNWALLNFAGFRANGAGSNWKVFINDIGEAPTAILDVDTGVALVAGWVRLEFYILDATHVDWVIEVEGGATTRGTNVATAGGATIPTGGMYPAFYIASTVADTPYTLDVDYFELVQS